MGFAGGEKVIRMHTRAKKAEGACVGRLGLIPLSSESDNHADTHCFGANFLILNFTNYYCTVTPFLDDLNTADEIPIGQGATAWDAPTGLTYIMVFYIYIYIYIYI